MSYGLAKAFDYVNHGLLLSKPSFYRIWNAADQWFKSYLNDKTTSRNKVTRFK